MKKLMSSLILLSVVFASGCGSDKVALVDLPTGDATNGVTVFKSKCADCHGDDGSGDSGPNIQNKSSDTVQETVRNGAGEMPSFSTDEISNQELADLIAYLKTQ